MMDCPFNQQKWPICRTLSRLRGRGMGGSGSPRIDLAIDEREAVVGDVVTAIGIWNVGVGWCGDVEGVDADDRFVGEG